MRTLCYFWFFSYLVLTPHAAPAPEPHPANPVTSLQNSIADLLAQIQSAQTSRSLTADRTTATALSQLQTVVTSIQSTFNGFVSNGLANLPAALAGGFTSIMSGVQSALNNAGGQLGQLIAARNSTSEGSSIEDDQLNTATASLSTVSTSWSSHVGSLLNQLSGLLTGIVDRLSGLPVTLNGLFG